MRKLYILGMILGMYATFSACNDEWKDELYTQMLSFKAPLGDNGLSEIYVRYQPVVRTSGMSPLQNSIILLNQTFAIFLRERIYSSTPSISTLTGWNWMRNTYFR